MIKLKSEREIEVMAHAGKILADAIDVLRRAVKPGVTTLDLDTLADEFIRGHDGATPAFKGIYGFPKSICTSINEEIVHGIPSKKRVLEKGDIVSLDVGVGYKGFFTDSATTVSVGKPNAEMKRLMQVTQDSLEAGIEQAVAGNHVGDIGAAVQAVVEAAGYSVVRDLVGHGVGKDLHEDPQVPNYGKPHHGTRLVPGLTIAIEPMVNIGGYAVKTLSDGWTIVTADGTRSAHFEHTVAVTDGAPLVLTRSSARLPA